MKGNAAVISGTAGSPVSSFTNMFSELGFVTLLKVCLNQGANLRFLAHCRRGECKFAPCLLVCQLSD